VALPHLAGPVDISHGHLPSSTQSSQLVNIQYSLFNTHSLKLTVAAKMLVSFGTSLSTTLYTILSLFSGNTGIANSVVPQNIGRRVKRFAAASSGQTSVLIFLIQQYCRSRALRRVTRFRHFSFVDDVFPVHLPFCERFPRARYLRGLY